ncbi:undecaprenyl diphosphate synthase [Denitrovibrio acetiphilus DSM 12809]|uniref:Isoprenyl transferase n=1 Tax=Denitrovibrio acetiphilus (strain DSM 12809 / NBRC 114555 / N2460) TaxID=522772 RepID=D4H3Y4_DENA2|nr:isoprenyl transferase [Denitrovibrio acetiphilus]ADD67295.1 undecaprenyl diphosphate synthase [Denitrovibrio acetiphilus DSM 12809]
MQDLKIPEHLAIIMDGNGRWAKIQGKPRIAGHSKGAEVVRDIVKYTSRLGVGYLTLYTFSMENWLRPKDEVGFLMELLEEYLKGEISELNNNNIRLTVSGRTQLLPEKTQAVVNEAVENLSKNTGMVLNLALSYGGRSEIVDAAKQMAKLALQGEIELDKIERDEFGQFMYHPEMPDIDLLIRTSGEIRISNFMLWRCAYSELFFTDVLWPDFGTANIDEAFEEYNRRVRRFGMTDEQVAEDNE